MKKIDLERWPRRRHFEFFKNMAQPHFNLTAPVDVSRFRARVREMEASLTVAVAWVVAGAVNEIPQLRQRIRGHDVIEHDVVHPSFTLLTDDELFAFCTVEYQTEWSRFNQSALLKMDEVRENPSLEDGPGADSLIFLTSIPWVAFTSIQHPMPCDADDSVPRIAWGRINKVDGIERMPLSVQAHHALADGLHAGRFFSKVQQGLDRF